MVLGFALGVVGGLVMEEPDLLLDYLLGRTEQVAVGSEPVAAAAPDVAAEPPAAPDVAVPGAAGEDGPAAAADAPASAARPEAAAAAPPPVESAAGEPLAGAAPEPPLPEVAAPPPAGSFAVQVGAFAEASAAEQLARRLRARGHPVYVAPSTGSDTARWRVRVGPLATRSEAEDVAERLEREERVSTWVLAEGPP